VHKKEKRKEKKFGIKGKKTANEIEKKKRINERKKERDKKKERKKPKKK
jgi:hypothetical protein